MTYQHDCGSCRSLGPYEAYDLYVCKDSVLARYGNEAHEYCSSLMQIILYADGAAWLGSPLEEAFRRVVEARDNAFRSAVAASREAATADEELNRRALDVSWYIAARDAHANAAAMHRNMMAGEQRLFHEMMAAHHEHRCAQLRLCCLP